jgi:hypothetical protein
MNWRRSVSLMSERLSPLAHELAAQRLLDVREAQPLAPHRLLQLLDGRDARLLGDAQHLAVDLGLDLFGHARHVLALLDEQRLVDEVEDDLGLALLYLGVGLLGRHPALLGEHVAELGVLALELREHDDEVVHLRDGLVEDDGRRFLLRARRGGRREREQEGREGEQGARGDVSQLHSHYSSKSGNAGQACGGLPFFQPELSPD